ASSRSPARRSSSATSSSSRWRSGRGWCANPALRPTSLGRLAAGGRARKALLPCRAAEGAAPGFRRRRLLQVLVEPRLHCLPDHLRNRRRGCRKTRHGLLGAATLVARPGVQAVMEEAALAVP